MEILGILNPMLLLTMCLIAPLLVCYTHIQSYYVPGNFFIPVVRCSVPAAVSAFILQHLAIYHHTDPWQIKQKSI